MWNKAKIILMIIGFFSIVGNLAPASAYVQQNIWCTPTNVVMKPPNFGPYGQYGSIVVDCPGYSDLFVLSVGAPNMQSYQTPYLYTEAQLMTTYKMLVDAAVENRSLVMLIQTSTPTKQIFDITCP